jgi:hypothetical protein
MPETIPMIVPASASRALGVGRFHLLSSARRGRREPRPDRALTAKLDRSAGQREHLAADGTGDENEPALAFPCAPRQLHRQ